MKGFTLPEACIPDWAKGLTEDSWKSKLDDTITVKSSVVNSSKKKS